MAARNRFAPTCSRGRESEDAMRRDSRGVTPRDTVPGLIKVPGKNELRPNARDRRGGEGPLAFVPAGSQQVQNFGGSSASAALARSIPTRVPKKKADETP